MELGVTPSSVTSTLSATLVLFQMPLNTFPLYRTINCKGDEYLNGKNIQTTRSYLGPKFYLVGSDCPILYFYLAPTQCGEMLKCVREKLSLLIFIRSCPKAFLK